MLKASWRNNAATQPLKKSLWKRRCRDVQGFIFLATTGRSGTLSFDEILKSLPGCVSLHEPGPIMNGEVLRRHNQGDDELMWQVWNGWKLPAIYKAAARARWYVESNHLFIKSFCHAAVEEFEGRLQVLHVVRHPHAVAASFLKRGSIPGTHWGDHWLGDYRAPRNLIQVTDVLDGDPHFAHPFFKVLWYWYEVEARTAQFRLDFSHVKVVDFATEEFNDANRLHELCETLFGPFPRAIVEAKVGTRAHASSAPCSVPDGLSDAQIAHFESLCQAQLRPLQGEREARSETRGLNSAPVLSA